MNTENNSGACRCREAAPDRRRFLARLGVAAGSLIATLDGVAGHQLYSVAGCTQDESSMGVSGPD